MTAPQPGDFAVVSVGGTPGRLIRLGEQLNGSGPYAEYQHALIYTGIQNWKGDRAVIQAEPRGAAYGPLTPHGKTLWSNGRIPLTGAQRDRVVSAAQGYVGTPYSALDYLAIALRHWHIPMICSQLVDQCYADAGVHLFADGRWPGYVTPADLAQLLEGRP